MVNRSAALIDAAHVYSIAETQGAVKQTSDTEATVPAEIVMTSSRLGTFTEDITIPLVSQHGQWRVAWSPGLLFPTLAQPTTDPNHTRPLPPSPAAPHPRPPSPPPRTSPSPLAPASTPP